MLAQPLPLLLLLCHVVIGAGGHGHAADNSEQQLAATNESFDVYRTRAHGALKKTAAAQQGVEKKHDAAMAEVRTKQATRNNKQSGSNQLFINLVLSIFV